VKKKAKQKAGCHKGESVLVDVTFTIREPSE